MREIKFRAWQKEPSLHRKRGMYLVDDLVFHDQGGGGEVFLHLPGEDSKSSEYFDDVHLMQYTGLKDKNGVEIYEGDICQIGSLKFPVEWLPVGWSMNLLNEEIEVIGNIHQHPNLLKTAA